MIVFTQQVINGVTLGCVYTLVVLGITMIFGILELIAFAQGAIFMLGAYVGLSVALSTYDLGWPVSLSLSITAAAITGAIANVFVDRIAYRPIRNSGRLAPLVSGIGIYVFLENAIGWAVGRRVFPYPEVLPSGGFEFLGVIVTNAQLVIVGLCMSCLIVLWLLVRRTDSGLMMRAVAERSETAILLGISSERIVIITFAVAGAFSGVAGALVGAFVGVVYPSMGFLIGIKAFAAAVIAGIGNVPGALVGGLIVGLTETFAAGYISAAWSDSIVFLILIVVLMFRPNGLLGARSPHRA